MKQKIEIQGCPIADRIGGTECIRGCGGGWPGTQITSEDLTRAVNNGGVRAERLGCGPLMQRAEVAMRLLNA